LCNFLEEAHSCGCHAAEIAASVRGNDTKKTGAGFLGEVGLFEETLGGVDVGEIERGARVAGIEYGC
jgi:hypothetical protein